MVSRTKDFLFTRQQAYQQTFNEESLSSQKVLEDLYRFCRGGDTTFNPDPRLHALLEGRREVWLRIQYHLKLDPDQLWKTYGRTDLSHE